VLVLEHLQMQMQSGHTEQAIARIQALLEFNCFSPEFPGVLDFCIQLNAPGSQSTTQVGLHADEVWALKDSYPLHTNFAAAYLLI